MENIKKFQTDPSLKLMDRVRQALSYYQYAHRTEQSYTKWIREYIRYLSRKKVPEKKYHREITSFVDHLSNDRNLSDSSCKQALNAISFLYKRVFDVPVDVSVRPAKIRKEEKTPAIMSKGEVKLVLSGLKGKHLLMSQLMYGAGLRLMECVRLRIHHINFKRNLIFIYPAKGGKERKVMIPQMIRQDLVEQADRIKKQHKKDLAAGAGQVRIPGIFTDGFSGTENDLMWQYLFPSKKITIDTKTGLTGRSHVLESGLQKAVHAAVKKNGIEKKISCSTFRHSFAVHLLENNVPLQTVRELMGHPDIRETQVYLKYIKQKDITELSPLDVLYDQ